MLTSDFSCSAFSVSALCLLLFHLLSMPFSSLDATSSWSPSLEQHRKSLHKQTPAPSPQRQTVLTAPAPCAPRRANRLPGY